MMVDKNSESLQVLITHPTRKPSDQVELASGQKLKCDRGLIHHLWRIRIFRFFVIGAINTLFSYLVYALLVLIGAHYSFATLVSTILGVIFNFFTTGRIVFHSMDNRRFLRFVLVYVFTFFVNILLLRWLVDGMQLDKLIAGAWVTLPVALLSYYLNANWTFKGMDLYQKNINKEANNA